MTRAQIFFKIDGNLLKGPHIHSDGSPEAFGEELRNSGWLQDFMDYIVEHADAEYAEYANLHTFVKHTDSNYVYVYDYRTSKWFVGSIIFHKGLAAPGMVPLDDIGFVSFSQTELYKEGRETLDLKGYHKNTNCGDKIGSVYYDKDDSQGDDWIRITPIPGSDHYVVTWVENGEDVKISLLEKNELEGIQL